LIYREILFKHGGDAISCLVTTLLTSHPTLVPQYRDGRCRFLDTVETAAVLCDRQARPINLAPTGGTAQLQHNFVDLTETCRSDRMTLRFKAPGRIDREPASQARFTSFTDPTTLADFAKSEVFNLDNLAKCRRIVNLGH
jgi:hypothetical protein